MSMMYNEYTENYPFMIINSVIGFSQKKFSVIVVNIYLDFRQQPLLIPQTLVEIQFQCWIH